jgi:hypothetical protein
MWSVGCPFRRGWFGNMVRRSRLRDYVNVIKVRSRFIDSVNVVQVRSSFKDYVNVIQARSRFRDYVKPWSPVLHSKPWSYLYYIHIISKPWSYLYYIHRISKPWSYLYYILKLDLTLYFNHSFTNHDNVLIPCTNNFDQTRSLYYYKCKWTYHVLKSTASKRTPHASHSNHPEYFVGRSG